MRTLFFLLITQFILTNSYGQVKILKGKPRLQTDKEVEMDERNQDCVYKKKYTPKQRLLFFPFNKATEIKLVSFVQPDSIIMGGKLPMKNGNVDYFSLKEIKTITKLQIDTLTDLLFNRGYRGPFNILSRSNCYNPRDAILFIDSTGKTFAFIEICFECMGYRLSSNKIKAGDFCNQKYDYLRDFFEANGIVYGVKKEALDE